MSDKEIYCGYTIEFQPEENPDNPRDWDHLGSFVGNHRRYNIWDDELKSHGESWDDDLKHHLSNKGLKLSDVICFPVYMLDHSWLRFSTNDFCDRWDSGQVWFIYTSKEYVRKWFSWKQITPHRLKQIYQSLINEIEQYDQYHSWGVYEFRILDPQWEEYVEWQWGYYDDSHIDEAKSYIDHAIKKINESVAAK